MNDELVQIGKKDKPTKQHIDLTQSYSTWGDKLLQHADVLNSIQNKGEFKPITIQLAPTEGCDSSCPFCSVAARPLNSYLPFEQIKQVLRDFKTLGAKSLEITGGGNPMIYRDRKSPGKENINHIIREAYLLGYNIGIITNSEKLDKIETSVHSMIDWIRISLIKLDEGKEPEDYHFNGFPYEKLGFSYIIYDECAMDPVRNKYYEGTSEKTIERIAKLVELHQGNIKFVRFAGNCLIKGNNLLTRKKFGDIVEANDQYKKFFLKTIEDDDGAFDNGCYVGMIRPYVAPSPKGGDYKVYICTSHVLNTRTYDVEYALCDIKDIIKTWGEMNINYQQTGHPYQVKGNGGCGWSDICSKCYYYNNNKLLHTVAQPMPDKNFP